MSALLAGVIAAAVVAGALLARSRSHIRTSDRALATLSRPLGGGQIVHVSAFSGAVPKDVPVTLRGNQIWPTRQLLPGQRITVLATIKRPSWISWLADSEQHVRMTVTTPVARLTSRFLTRAPGTPLTVNFTQPVAVAGAGALDSRFDSRPLARPQSSLTLRVAGEAGTVAVAAAVRSWERLTVTRISWFPPGRRATVVSTPAPETRIDPLTPITLTFSKPVRQVLGTRHPPVSPTTRGAWHSLNAHTIVFRPRGYGYGLGATVKVLLPAGVQLVGAASQSSPAGGARTSTQRRASTDPVVGSWSVPQPSTMALQELLADLGYLPVRFTPDHAPASSTGVGQGTLNGAGATPAVGPAGVAPTIASEERLIVSSPTGRFSWRYPHTPVQLKQLWSAQDWTELTKGAVMAFENDQGLNVDGIAGPEVWKALITAVVKGERSPFGYTFVMVSEHQPESISVWHNGRIVVHGPANTGIASAPTALGTYAVFEHLKVTTMSGLNPDGTPYHDPGIPWVSYFNGGDALHGFTRASYGFPQSLGCVEMPFAEAGAVWPYTPIGTIVHLT